ncbi:MAG: homoserine dehydrogenase [Acidimicrobiia bacterium]|nr:homoserine dehydrogenase [Acidimicrobiia bacterium]
MQTVGVGILGSGTVGGTLVRRLLEEQDVIAQKAGLRLELRRIAVRSLDKTRPYTIPPHLLTDQATEVIDDSTVELVVEVMGGLDPAGSLVLRALEAGKPVVTANKELVAARGLEFVSLAEKRGVSLLFEAAVGGGIPIIRPLSESLAGERVLRVMGIVNGTTNYILTKMLDEGADYGDALAEAQALGFAEADPAADVSGDDAAAKAAILASLAFGTWVDAKSVFREGIEGLRPTDFRFAANLGFVPKLLAIAEDTDAGVLVRVHPTLVPKDHPLASVRGANNAIFLEGPAVGELLFAGPGAGGEPTATAVLGDVIDAARELLARSQVAPRIRFAPGRVLAFEEAVTKWYVRLEVEDAPGVLAAVATVFGEHEVSIASVWQDGRGDEATLLIVTHDAREGQLAEARLALDSLDAVRQVASVIRVQSDAP